MDTFKVWIKALNGTTTSNATVKSESSTLAFSSSDHKNKHFIAATSTQTTKVHTKVALHPTSATASIKRLSRRRTTKSGYYMPNFHLYRPESFFQTTTPDAIRAALIKNLTSSDLKAGFIYLYWFPGNFGYVKIGMTTRSIQKRLEEWARQCGHDASPAYAEQLEGMQHAVAVPHVRRVETLVHAELREVRYKEVGCRECGKTHREWFRVDLASAKRVVGKWRDWVGGRPYEEMKGEKGKGKWVLKRSMGVEEIESLVEPLESEKVSVGGKRPALRRGRGLSGRKGRSSRGSGRWSG